MQTFVPEATFTDSVRVLDRQLPHALAGDLEDRVGNRGLNRRRAVVSHADQPVPGREEADVDLGWVFVDPGQRERVEVVLDDAPVLDRAGLMHGIVVEPGDLPFNLLPHRQRIDQAEARLVRHVDALELDPAATAHRDGVHHGADRGHAIAFGAPLLETDGPCRARR